MEDFQSLKEELGKLKKAKEVVKFFKETETFNDWIFVKDFPVLT